MENLKTFTLSIYTENNSGLLNRISGIFLRRRIDIESLNLSTSEIHDVMRFSITVNTDVHSIKKITGQIDKQIEVIKTFYHTADELIFRDHALFKIQTQRYIDYPELKQLFEKYGCTPIEENQEYMVLSLLGNRKRIKECYTDLLPFGLLQFISSGSVCVSKSEMPISRILDEQQV